MTQGFRSRLLGGETLYGTMLTLPSPEVAEILAATGFDWLFIDGEHGAIDARELLAIMQAVGQNLACIYRVPRLDAGTVKRALDLGADGIIVPQVNTVAEAAEAVRLARYAPEGERGIGLSRAHRYGFEFGEYLARANADVALIVQAEHIRAVENIEGIVAVPGIDAILLGPYDLSASLGRPGDIRHPEVAGAIAHITRACQEAGIPLGYFGLDANAVGPMVEQGYTLICAGIDCVLLGQSARQLADELKG